MHPEIKAALEAMIALQITQTGQTREQAIMAIANQFQTEYLPALTVVIPS